MANEADWTVMVYLAGDNNLTEEMVRALKEMTTWAAPKTNRDPQLSMKVVAQFDPSAIGIPTQRYDFSKLPDKSGRFEDDLEKWRVKELDLKKWWAKKRDELGVSGGAQDPLLNETNTGNPNALRDFIVWGAHEHPAKHYEVILSGHGSGTTEDFLLKDENAIDSLSIPELQEALKGARRDLKRPQRFKFDILGMDSCLMSMVEVCHSLKDCVKIVIGAEGFEPESGWPYYRLLQAIKKDPVAYQQPPEKAKMIVEEYVRYYSDYDRSVGRSVDLAAIDLEKMELSASVRKLANVLKRASNDKLALEQVIRAHWDAQTYKFDQYTDLRDFCEQIRNRALRFPRNLRREIKVACRNVMNDIDACVILSGCAGFAYQHSYGLSIYFPWSVVSDAYGELAKKLDLGFVTQWHKFLQSYVKKSRRPPRPNGFFEQPDANDSLRSSREVRRDWEEAFNAAMRGVLGRNAVWRRNTISDRERRRVLNRMINRIRPALLPRGTPRTDQFGAAGGGHRYDRDRYDRDRYDRDRYDRNRYDNERDRWAKNPSIGSGIAFWKYGKDVTDQYIRSS